MIVGKACVICLAVGVVVVAGCAHSDSSARSRMDKPKWKSGLEPVAGRKLDELLPAEPDILPQTHFAAAQLLEKKGMIPDAIAQYRKAIAVNHQYVQAYHALGVLLSRVGDHKGAVRTMAQAAKIRPDDPVIQNNYGYLLMHDESWVKAIEQFDGAIAHRPFFARAHINRGLCLAKLGRFDAAFDSFRTVLPEADAHYNMGLMYRGQRLFKEANRSFQRVLDINPSFVAATQQLAEIAPLATRGDAELMGPPDGSGERQYGSQPLVMIAQSDAGRVSAARPRGSSPKPVAVAQARPKARPLERDRIEDMTSPADWFDFAVGPTCPADFVFQVASFDEDMVRCAQVFFEEATEAVATADPRRARATKAMTVEPEPVDRVQPVNWGAAFSELWEELPPDPNDPCTGEGISFPREQMTFYPGMGFFAEGMMEMDFASPDEDQLASLADPDVIRSVEQRSSTWDPIGDDGYGASMSSTFSRQANLRDSGSTNPMDALMAIEERIAMERSEQACLEQELGTFATGRWVDTSVTASASADMPEMNVHWETTKPASRFAPKASLASDTNESAQRDNRHSARSTGSRTLGMSIVEPSVHEPALMEEDLPCSEDSDGVLDPRGASAGSLEYLFEIMNMASNDKWCLDAAGLQQIAQPEVVDTSPSDWDDQGVAERNMEPYERATLGSRVVEPEQRGSDRVQRRARPTPRRYRLGKSTTKGMIDPVRN